MVFLGNFGFSPAANENVVSGHFAGGLNRLDGIRIGSLVSKAGECMMLCPWELSIDFFCSFLALQSFLPVYS